MSDPFIAWVKLVKDLSTLYIGHYSNEMFLSTFECNLSDSNPELMHFKEFCPPLLPLNPSIRIRVIQTLVNSWSTSRRLHEPKIHKCSFCGEWEDDMPHYLNCSVLRCLILFPVRMSKDLLSAPPQFRIGMLRPNSKGMKLVACAFSVYHAIRLQYLEVALLAHSDVDLLPLVQLILNLADLHLSEMNFFGKT